MLGQQLRKGGAVYVAFREVYLPALFEVFGQSFEDTRKDSFFDPSLEAAVAGLVGRVAFGEDFPGRSRAQYIQRMPFSTSRGSRQGLPRPSSLRGGSGTRGSNTFHCSSVRSMLFYSSCQKDVRQSHSYDRATVSSLPHL